MLGQKTTRWDWTGGCSEFDILTTSLFSIFLLVMMSQSPAMAQHALDANPSVQGRMNPVRDPLAQANRHYIVGDRFGGGSFEEPHRNQFLGAGQYNGEKTLGRSLRLEAEGSSAWKIHDERLKQMRQPQQIPAKKEPQSTLRGDLRNSGQRLELSASYKSDMLIERLPARTELILGDCIFYDELLLALSVQRGTAVEAKIRKLNLKESEQFLDLYRDRLKSQGRLSDELRDQLDVLKRQIVGDHCAMKEPTDREPAPAQD
jgi:hypothetical protein